MGGTFIGRGHLLGVLRYVHNCKINIKCIERSLLMCSRGTEELSDSDALILVPLTRGSTLGALVSGVVIKCRDPPPHKFRMGIDS